MSIDEPPADFGNMDARAAPEAVAAAKVAFAKIIEREREAIYNAGYNAGVRWAAGRATFTTLMRDRRAAFRRWYRRANR